MKFILNILRRILYVLIFIACIPIYIGMISLIPITWLITGKTYIYDIFGLMDKILTKFKSDE